MFADHVIYVFTEAYQPVILYQFVIFQRQIDKVSIVKVYLA